MSQFQTIHNRSYETQVVLLISFLATLRMLIAIVVDVTRTEFKIAELATDITLLLVFGGLFCLGFYKAKFKSVNPVFGVLLIFLLALNFMEFGGVHGNTRFNYYAGFFVIILLYKERTLIALLVLQCAVVIGLTIWTTLAPEGKTILFLSDEAGPDDFIFIIVALGALAMYVKSITEREVNRLEELSTQLNDRVAEAKNLNHELVSQGQELTKAQEHLEFEVVRRTASLMEKQKAIEKYIHLNTQVLQTPMQDLNASMKAISSTSALHTMLVVSHLELNEVLKNITATLQAQEELNRTKVK